MRIVHITLEDGRKAFATREDIDSGVDVPLRTRDGRPTQVNVKAADIILISARDRVRKMTAVQDMFGAHGPVARSSDEVYTPDWCAADMVRHFRPTGRILEPCRGAGAFMRHLPPDAFWCEINDGRDFFAWDEPVDWIITNPPFSITHAFLRHAIEVASEIVFLVPVRNIFSGYAKIRECAGWGGLSAIRWYGPGSRLGFPMGNPIAALQWSRGKKGTVHESFYDDDAAREAACLS